MCSNFDPIDGWDVAFQGAVYQARRVARQSQQDTATVLLQMHCLLVGYQEWLVRQSKDDERRAHCEALIRANKEALGEILVLLNSSDDEEYVQPGKIIN